MYGGSGGRISRVLNIGATWRQSDWFHGVPSLSPDKYSGALATNVKIAGFLRHFVTRTGTAVTSLPFLRLDDGEQKSSATKVVSFLNDALNPLSTKLYLS